MRRKIELWIDGTLADTSDQSYVLMNYSVTDLQKPSTVKNSYSKQITLPGTPVNDRIFGGYGRADRATGGGFDALTRTPFTIYDDMSEIVESGYLRLDEVQRKGDIVTGYKVTLYGGLGSFFAGLSYTDAGEKMTLADLDYLGTDTPERELDFIINADNLAAAWARLRTNPAAVEQMWDVLNFAPAYEGYPDGDFDADKGYGPRAANGLPTQTGYSADSANSVVIKFPQKVDGWAVKDFRSYLQRPVVSIRAMLAAMQRRAAAIGWTFDYSDIPTDQYRHLWKTLPLIPSLGTLRRSTGALTATRDNIGDHQTPPVARWTLAGQTAYAGLSINASLAFRLVWDFTGIPIGTDLYMVNESRRLASFAFLQLVGKDADGNVVGSSDVLVVGPHTCTLNSSDITSFFNYQPQGTPAQYLYYPMLPYAYTVTQRSIPDDVVMGCSAIGATHFDLYVTAYKVTGRFDGGRARLDYRTGGTDALPAMWSWGTAAEYTPYAVNTVNAVNTTDLIEYSTASEPRSGAALSKALLLNTKHTPAEYLISLAKVNGWLFLTDTANRSVTLMRRDTFYGGGDAAVDLTERVDQGKGITYTPMNLTSKWYNFALAMAEGAFAKEYRDTYGIDYGIQRVDTGYDFDAAEVNLMDGNAFRAAACIQAHGPWWKIVTDGGSRRCALFTVAGNTYKMWDANGGEKWFDVPVLAGSSIATTYYNTEFEGYDLAGVTRLELRDKDGKGIDGDDILVRFEESKVMNGVNRSDDSAAMLAANGGKPCWYIAGGSQYYIPVFSRYHQTDGVVTESLDFGTPREVDIPKIRFAATSSLYRRRWQAYMRDILDVDTKVMRCRVRLDGIRVDASLLRRFFWYGGCWWVLNSVSNYSLTTFDTVECEFVRVTDKDNYTNGQI